MTTQWYSYPPIPPPPPPIPPLPPETNNPPQQQPSPVPIRGDDFLKRVRYLNPEIFSPVLFVLDFDHTIAYHDSRRLLDIDFMDNNTRLYTRPFLRCLLNYVRCVNKHNVLILWTAGAESYIQRMLVLCDIAPYFHHVLTYQHCRESQDRYGTKKAYAYLKCRYPEYADLRSVLVDNLAVTNAVGGEDGETYTYIYSVEPFTPRKIVQSYGAFHIDQQDIMDLDLFIRTKGLRGKQKRGKGHETVQSLSHCDPYQPDYGDTVLVSLILRLDREVFGNPHSPIPWRDSSKGAWVPSAFSKTEKPEKPAKT